MTWVRAAGLAVAFATSADATAAPPDAAIATSRPATLPATSRSVFDPSLRCMDELLARSRVNYEIPLLLDTFEDAKGNSGVVLRDLLASSLSRITERSRLFRVFPKPSEADQNKPLAISLLGSITGLDDAVHTKGNGGGISIGPFSIGDERQKVDGVLTITLYLADRDGAILSGTLQSLSMTLQAEQRSNDLSGSVSSVGGSLSLSFGRKDGLLPAARALIDLAVIQATAAYAAVPPERCLGLVAATPPPLGLLRARYDKLKPPRALAAIADGLVARGYLQPPAPRTLTPELTNAIAEFEGANGLNVIGAPSFDVWAALLDPRPGPAPSPPMPAGGPLLAVAAAAPVSAALPQVRITPHGVHLQPDNDGTHFRILQGMRAELGISVTQTAYVVCFHTDRSDRSTIIFPNAQRPDRPVRPGEVLPIPGPEDKFVLEASSLGEEKVTCAAAAKPFRLTGAMGVAFDPALRQPPLPETTPEALVIALRRAGNDRFSVDSLHIISCKDEERSQCATRND